MGLGCAGTAGVGRCPARVELGTETGGAAGTAEAGGGGVGVGMAAGGAVAAGEDVGVGAGIAAGGGLAGLDALPPEPPAKPTNASPKPASSVDGTGALLPFCIRLSASCFNSSASSQGLMGSVISEFRQSRRPAGC